MPRFDFLRHRTTFYAASLVLLLLALFGLFVVHLNLGIDFTGGTVLDARFARPVSLARLHEVLAGQHLGQSVAQYVGSSRQEVLLNLPSLTEPARLRLEAALRSHVGPFATVSLDKVTGSMSAQIVHAGILAVIVAAAAIVLYMMLRFDWRFAIAGIVAVFWDAIVSVGIIALLHVLVNTPFVAGVLTIVGYSINDRIIIFDRIRENLKARRAGESLADLVNRSLNQTLGRSINTALIVVLAMLSILVLGGDTTRDLAATVVVGVVFGAYSSILLASPIWYDWVTRAEAQAKKARAGVRPAKSTRKARGRSG
jgi:preprotein translocase subunit SecF